MVPQIILAYLNMEVFIPRFFSEKKYLEYFLLVLFSLVIIYFIHDFISDRIILPHRRIPPIFGENSGFRELPRKIRKFFFLSRNVSSLNMLLTLAILFLSTAFKVSKIALMKEKEAAQLKSENLNAELKFLKSQINPHFLFNALNNVYALSVIKSDKAPEMILKLSDMLRYILYDCNEQKVSLDKELNYIKNYISLQ
ncbi:histidine kinase, partial [Cytophagales bacterium RKSG123]|nr:histidine kinase [Xanthovirga aplysinae]